MASEALYLEAVELLRDGSETAQARLRMLESLCSGIIAEAKRRLAAPTPLVVKTDLVVSVVAPVIEPPQVVTVEPAVPVVAVEAPVVKPKRRSKKGA